MNDDNNNKGRSVALRQVAVDAPDYHHYRPLNAERREIRVLDLESRSACTLRHVSLDDAPNYYALSYCWGPSTSTRPLNIKQVGSTDVQVVTIRRTLTSFLKNLFVRFGPICIWLDVVCINQRSFVEQSAQVSMMGDIYREALGVYAWMGKWDPDIDFLFAHCNANPTGDGYESSNKLEKISLAVKVLSQRPY